MWHHVNVFATHFEVNGETVSNYAKTGLLHPVRDPANGYQLFSKTDVKHLKFIRRAKHIGFTLKEIKQIMEENVTGKKLCPRIYEFLRGQYRKRTVNAWKS